MYVQVQWTAPNEKEAREIAKALVQKKLVACANILPHVDSYYIWQNELKEDREVKVFLKTRDDFFQKVADYILSHTSYEIPEISKFSITDANPDYIAWLFDALPDEK